MPHRSSLRAEPPAPIVRRALCALVALAIVVEPFAPSIATGQTPAQGTPAPTAPASETSPSNLPVYTQPAYAIVPALPPDAVLPLPQLNMANIQTTLPDLGDASFALVSPAQERKLGEMVARQIHGSGGYLDDPEVNDYLNELGHRLVAARPDSPWDFEFSAMADPGINAFAIPGGFIFVNMGLILMTQTESELASVLAHEITHVTQHHYVRGLAAQKDAMLLSIAAMLVAIAAGVKGGSQGGQVASAAIATAQGLAIQGQLNYTRQNEYEADRIGFQRLYAAGFATDAMATMFQRLLRGSRFSDNSTPGYLRTHPVTTERIAEAQARAEQVPYRQVQDSLDFQMVRALLQSYQGTPREAVQYFDAAIADKKFNNAVAVHYGLVASLLRANNLPRAKVELAALEKIAPPHPMIEAIAGHIYMESGDLDIAQKRIEAALVRYPNKLQLIRDYPEVLLRQGRPADAAKFLEGELVRFPDNGPLHGIAARAYGELGQKTQQHRHQAELYAWQGDTKGAITQLELAIKANDGDFYQYSVVETRLRSLRRDLEDQKALAKNG
jgi:predicted Zn-dependent protease